MNPMTDANRNESNAPTVLGGIRVLDMARVLAGPWAAQLLADFGAEVTKIERPAGGDDSRSWEPSFVSPHDPQERHSAYFCSANRGKQSVTIDFADPQGAGLVRDLAASSDVRSDPRSANAMRRTEAWL